MTLRELADVWGISDTVAIKERTVNVNVVLHRVIPSCELKHVSRELLDKNVADICFNSNIGFTIWVGQGIG